MVRADEVVGWGDLLGEVVARGAEHVEQTHLGIADRVFGTLDRAMPRVATPIRLLHHGITRTVHAGVRVGGRVVGRGAGRLAALRTPADAPAGVTDPRAVFAQSAIVGLVGDQLHAAGNAVAFSISLRTARGAAVDIEPGALDEAFGPVTDEVAVFVHGLCETEAYWRHRAVSWWQDPESSHATRLRPHGITPVYVRYPSGHPIDDNGDDLARLVAGMVDAWPVPVRRVVLVGHSMGALVVRHAVHAAAEAGDTWVDRCSDVVCLGAPILGAPLARGAAAAVPRLSRIPEVAALGAFLEHRSVGIRDLEHVRDVPHPDHVDLHLVGATLTARDSGRLAEVVGDLLVGPASSSGRGQAGTAAAASVRVFTRRSHFDLLNHPEVWEHLVEVLAGAVPTNGQHALTDRS